MMLRKRQSWTVTWDPPNHAQLADDPTHPGNVAILFSDTGEVRRVNPGDTVLVDASLELTPLERGWELVPV